MSDAVIFREVRAHGYMSIVVTEKPKLVPDGNIWLCYGLSKKPRLPWKKRKVVRGSGVSPFLAFICYEGLRDYGYTLESA